MLSRLLLTLTLVLAACNTRPGPEVLAPDDGALPAGARIVQVLTVTTRAPDAQSPGAYGATRSYAGIWVMRPDQAARFLVSRAATPSVNVMPSMSKGNWFAPFRRRQVLAVA